MTELTGSGAITEAYVEEVKELTPELDKRRTQADLRGKALEAQLINKQKVTS